MNETQQQAHKYAEHGWPVFPCIPGEKVPVTSHGFEDATTEHRVIQRWWARNPERNVALRTGAPGPDVLDVDVHPEGNGFAAYNQLKRAGLVPQAQAIVQTPSGGMHAYYRGTDQRNGHLPRHHLDYRSQGGYVVAPPSQVNGRPYAVVQRRASAATFDWGKARDHLEPQPERPAAPLNGAPSDGRDVDRLADWVARQPEGNRNAGLFYAANRLLEKDGAADLSPLAVAARQAGLDDREITRTLDSARRTAEPRPFDREMEAS